MNNHSVRRKPIPDDAKRHARSAGLRYVSDDSPGITRKKAGASFQYFDRRGRRIRNVDTLTRIRNLAIPPAYSDVWISANPHGHIQAVGRDVRGRKQYRYHARWREVRDEAKYEHMVSFARALPKIRQITRRQLRLEGLPREKILAAVVQIMEKTLIRVGNDEYANHNHSYGLTTLQDRHAKVARGKVQFTFRGKSGKDHEIDLADPTLAAIVKKSQDLPGQELFQYRDADGKVRDIGSSDVNDYLREITGSDFTAKDFRTWAGTVLAAKALQELDGFRSQKEAKRNLTKAVERVAERLGNTIAVCRKCYIHPEILNAYLDGTLQKNLIKRAAGMANSRAALRPDERAVLNLLRNRLANGA
jgi:DNA topoisomerase-1